MFSVRRLFEKRTARYRGVAVLPGAIALLVLPHAFEDAGPIGAAPYVAIALMSAWYLVRPMWICWGLLFGAFVAYTVAVALHPDNGRFNEWIIFLLLGAVPACLLWFARPRE